MNESILHAAFVPFGDFKDAKTPLDQASLKQCAFYFGCGLAQFGFANPLT